MRREEKRHFKKDMVIKCENEPKLFYKYINGKMKYKETIDKIVKGEKTYQTAKELSEIMNKSFKFVFTEDKAFTEPNMAVMHEGFQEVVVYKQDVDIAGKSGCKEGNGAGWSVRLNTKEV